MRLPIPPLGLGKRQVTIMCAAPVKNSRLPVKILFLTTSFSLAGDDPSVFFIQQLATALADWGHEVEVLTPHCSTPAREWDCPYCVTRFSYAARRHQVLAQRPGGIPAALEESSKHYLLVPPFLLAFGRRIVKHGRPAQVILANWAVTGALAYWTRSFHRKPIITILRGSDAKFDPEGRLIQSTFLKAAIKGSRRVVCVAEELTDKVRDNVSDLNKVVHIPNGVHEEFMALPEVKPCRPIHFMFIGSLIPRKRVDVLLKATAHVKADVRVTIVGDGVWEAELKNMAHTLGLNERVAFVGRIPPGRAMAQAIGRTHVLVLPSFHEGRPNVVIESMAGGRAIIGSNISGTRELITQSGAGILFPVGDHLALAAAMDELAASPAKIQRLGRRARSWIVSRGLTWENTADRYSDLIAEAVMGEQPGAL